MAANFYIPRACFHFAGKSQTRTIKVVVFRKVSFEPILLHISLEQKKGIVVTGVKLVTKVEQP